MRSGEVVIGESTMLKRPQTQEQSTTKLKKRKRQKHLYLVLDDWDNGYTIRKIDVDADSSPVLSLSDPPVLRLASPAPGYRMLFTSVGSHILAASNQHPVTLAYDTDTQALSAGPSLPDALLGASNILLPAADTLYAFGYYFTEKPQSVEAMSSSAKNPQSCLIPSKHWSWRSVASPFTVKERICSSCLLSYVAPAVHATVPYPSTLMTVNGGAMGNGYCLSRAKAALTVSEMQQQLDWKMAKDKLWSEEQQVALCPTLTSMGNAKFCLVDCVKGTGFYGCILHITTFRLRYDRKGELEIFDRNTRSCPVFKHLVAFSPVAFWM